MNNIPYTRALALSALASTCALAQTAQAQLQPNTLKCEYAVNPLGLDEARPRLSWLLSPLNPTRRGARQSAYQILVASSESSLRAGRGDLWDSGRIQSNAQNQIEYAGRALAPRRRAFWKVRAWDENGKPGSWSTEAWWESGLGEGAGRQNWGAQWIAPRSERAQSDLGSARWIWSSQGAQNNAEGGTRLFRWSFETPADLGAASLILTADDSWTLWINGQQVARSGNDEFEWKKIESRDISKYLRPGRNTIAVQAANAAAGPAGLLARLEWKSAQGSQVLASDKSWKTSAPLPANANWQAPEFDDSNWQAAVELGSYGIGPWGDFAAQGTPDERYLRREFSLAKPIRRARLYATALGVYEARLNGRKVSRDVFAPGWTDYKKRVQYQSYDVTSLVRRGSNALGFALGDGWFCGKVGLTSGAVYGTRPLLLCRLEVEHTDGSRSIIGSDGSWKSAKGPTMRADMLDGESFDARASSAIWDTPVYDDSRWARASVASGREGKVDLDSIAIEAQRGPSVRVTQEIKPRAVREAAPGKWVFDLGQNMVGWARLQVLAPRGTKISLRFAEMLNPDGTIYTANFRGARCLDEYTARGGGLEVWEPSFTFRGFRYVEVSGLSSPPNLSTITGVVAHSDTPLAGDFQCSSELVNQLQRNIVWGQRGNFLSVPTDCPQRDERLGWTGDAQIFVATSAYNADVAAFFGKWMVDVEDAMRGDAFTDVVPDVCCGAGSAAWADAGVIVPWSIYRAYGDKRILEKHYGAMARFIGWCWTNSKDGIRPAQGYGDWLQIGADTPKDVLATAYFAYSTQLMARAAQVLGKPEDARRYQGEFERLKSAFNAAFVSSDGRIKGNTQTVYLLALRFGLLPENGRAQASKYLTDDIAAKNGHLSTGFVGVGYLNPVLTSSGRSDVAYGLLLNDTFPSWGYSIRQGATTIWERWDGWTKEKGFQDAGMNSFNHYSLGSVGQWMFESVAGIGADESRPGFEHILLRPQIDPRLSWARAHHDSIRGRIQAGWQKQNGILTYAVTIPANSSATLWLPNAQNAPVREGGVAVNAVNKALGVRSLGREGEASKFELGSGTYRFEVRA